MRCDIGHGVYLREAVQSDIEYLMANLRDGDREEYEASKNEEAPWNVETFEECVTVMHEKYGIVGVWGSDIIVGHGYMSTLRAWAYLTTHNVEKFPVDYVRASRAVLRALWARERPWVEGAIVVPTASYKMSNNWVEKVLCGGKLDCDVVRGGVRHTAYLLEREV